MRTEADTSGVPSIPKSRVLLLTSKWYPDVIDGLSQGCRDYLVQLGCTDIEQHRISGSLEMPFAINFLLRSNRTYDAIICLGVILKGDTLHFEMITREVFHGLARLSLEHNVPIINEILPVIDISHAEERARDDKFNKGKEAAIAAAEIVAWRRQAGLGVQ